MSAACFRSALLFASCLLSQVPLRTTALAGRCDRCEVVCLADGQSELLEVALVQTELKVSRYHDLEAVVAGTEGTSANITPAQAGNASSSANGITRGNASGSQKPLLAPGANATDAGNASSSVNSIPRGNASGRQKPLLAPGANAMDAPNASARRGVEPAAQRPRINQMRRKLDATAANAKAHGRATSQRSGRPQPRGKNAKSSRMVSLGIPQKLDIWGQLAPPKRARFLLPIGCLVVPGTIFALLHIQRSPWSAPKDADQVLDSMAKPRAATLCTPASRGSAPRHSRSAPDRSPSAGSSMDADTRKDPHTVLASKMKRTPEVVDGARRLRRRKTEYGFVDKMFLKHWNSRFGENAQLTLRGAMLALIAGLPLILPETSFPGLQQFQKTGFWSVGAITLFIFTLWKTVGETLCYAWQGLLGTFVASLDIWIMFGLFPGGVTEISPPGVFWIGIVNGGLFIVVILWLNVDDNTKMFGLMNFVWFWMAFMDPDRSDLFSQGFLMTAKSSEISSLLAAVSGSGLAVTATLLPFPLWALGKACQGSHDTVVKLGVLWSSALETYCATGWGSYENDRLVRELMALHRDVDRIRENIRSAWWECFGLGSWQRVRLMLTRLTVVLQDDLDRLYCVLNATLNTEAAKKERRMAGELEERLRDVITEAQWLMTNSAGAACRGGFISSQEVEAAKFGIQRMNEAMSILTIEFRELKQEGGGPKLSEGLMEEHAICYNLCALARLSTKFTQDLLKCQEESSTAHMPKIQESVGFWGIFDRQVLFDPFYLVYVLRTSLRILVCFFLGYSGYSNVVRGKNAGIAIPATLLLMRYSGSAIQKNARRLQAVVLGTVTGMLIHALVGQCIWWGYALTGCLYFLWLLLTLFLYFDAADNSYSGLLMAYFGTVGILRGCSDENFDPSLTHYPITNTVVAIFVVTFFDIVAHPGRAAPAAHEAYVRVWHAMKKAVMAIFDANVTNVKFHRGEMMALVVQAEALGHEAEIEPRWWRIPWPSQVYEKAIQCSFQLCACMSNMEHTVAMAGVDGAPKDEVFQALQQVSAFQGLGAVLLAKMTQMEKLLKIFVHETTEPMAELDSPSLMVGYVNHEHEARKRFLEEISKLESMPSVAPKKMEGPKVSESDARAMLKRRLSYNFQVSTLEADPASQVSLLLSDIDQMIRTMRFLHHIMLRY